MFEAEYAHSYKQVQEDLRKALENNVGFLFQNAQFWTN